MYYIHPREIFNISVQNFDFWTLAAKIEIDKTKS